MANTKSPLLLLLLILTTLAIYTLYNDVASPGKGSSPVLTGYFSAIAQVPWSEIIDRYGQETGVEIIAKYGSTGQVLTLASVAGGDIIAVASIEDMRKAVELGIVDNNTVEVVSCSVPAIIVPRGNPAGIHSLRDLAKPGIRIGIGDPESVVIGRYAVELLKYNGLWDDVKGNIVVYADSFSTLMSMLISGQGSLDAVIGWHVGYYWYPDKTELIMLSKEEVPRATCITVGVLEDSKYRDEARKFIDYVVSGEGIKVFNRYGYLDPGEVLEYAESVGDGLG